MLGPFDEPPIPGMIFSPINLVPKAGSKDEYRLIHDLVFPYDGINGVNNHIPECNSKVKYRHFDEVIDIAMKLGIGTHGGRVDIHFWNLPLREDQLFLMGFTLHGKIYINCTLPFGAASSCLIFEKVATLIQWIATNETKKDSISHYLDNFPLLGESLQETQDFMDEFTAILNKINLPVAENKTIGQTPFLIYLGLLLNSRDQVLVIPQPKIDKCTVLINNLLLAYRSRVTALVHDIQELAGQLNFICQAVPAGRHFLSSFYALAAPIKNEKVRPTHHR